VKAIVQLMALLAVAASSLAAAPYTFQTIAIPGSLDTRALAINSSGQVLVSGFFEVPVGGLIDHQYGYFVVQGATIVPVVLPFLIFFPGGGINDHGAIAAMGTGAGFLLDGGELTYPIAFPGSFRTDVLGINDTNAIVGWFQGEAADNFNRVAGFLRSPAGDYSILSVPGGDVFTEASGINNAGDIVGRYAGHQAHGFLLRDGVYTDLLYPGSSFTDAKGINNHGDIVGTYDDLRGFVFSGGIWSAFDVPGASATQPLGINDDDVIVGFYSGGGITASAFVAYPVPEPGGRAQVGIGLAALLIWLIGRRSGHCFSRI
jgi:uncharacterized membrane protein